MQSFLRDSLRLVHERGKFMEAWTKESIFPSDYFDTFISFHCAISAWRQKTSFTSKVEGGLGMEQVNFVDRFARCVFLLPIPANLVYREKELSISGLKASDAYLKV